MGSKQPTITTGLTVAQVHKIASSVNPAVKNATEAKSFLASKGWIAPGDPVSMDVLAKALFATVVHSSKLPQATSTTIASIAYLLTEKQEDGILENLTNTISLHIKDTLDSITSDMHVKLDQHIQQITETAQTQTTLTDKLIKAQEHLEETAQKSNDDNPNVQPGRRESPSTCATTTTTTPDFAQPNSPTKQGGGKEKTSAN